MRGNVVELAVAVVIGAAFTTLINAVVSGLFNPLIAAIFGASDLTEVGKFTVNSSPFLPGLVLDALVKFLVIAAAVYLVIVLPLNAFAARRKQGAEPEPSKPAEDVLLLQEIRDLLAAQDQRSAQGQRSADDVGSAQDQGAAQDPESADQRQAAQEALTGARPTTGAHAALAPTDAARPRPTQG